jgi:hypothetical protein
MELVSRVPSPNVGDVVASANDQHYMQYCQFCQRFGYPAASYQDWLKVERREAHLSPPMVSHARSRHQLAALQAIDATMRPSMSGGH